MVTEQSFQEHIVRVQAEIQSVGSGIVDALARQEAARRQREDAERQLNVSRHRFARTHVCLWANGKKGRRCLPGAVLRGFW